LDLIVDILLAFSIAGALATVVTFVLFKDIRTYPIKLIVFLCICIFMSQTFFWSSFREEIYDGKGCVPVAFIYHYFFLCNFFWTFCIAFNFYQMIVRRNRDAEALEKWYHIVCWLVPLVICIIVVSTGNYGKIGKGSGQVCYMKSGLAVFLAFFLPGLIIVSANAVIFFFIAREIHDTLASAPKSDKSEKRKEFRVYLSIFISIGLSWIFGFIMVLFSNGSVGQVIFMVIFSLTTPLQGYLIYASYCLNAKVFARWAGFLGKAIPYCRRFEHMGSSTTSGTSGTSGTSSSASSRM